MDLDVAGSLNAAVRSVSWTAKDEQPALTVIISRSLETTEQDLWSAVTSRERIPRWFLPVSGELELGGRFQLEGNAGGAITECRPPSHLALTWEFAGDLSWVEVDISGEDGGRVRLTLFHTALLSEFWNTYGPGAVGVGWEMALLGLSLHIADPQAVMPDEAAFAASTEGRALIAGSSESWAQASIAAGQEPGTANAAAARTTAFYTGEPSESE